MNPLLTIVVSTYDQYKHKLPILLHSLALQTDQRFKIKVIHDGPPPSLTVGMDIWQKVPHEPMFSVQRTNNWGHSARLEGLNTCDTKYIHFTNGDNYYVPVFVEYMLRAIEEGEGYDYVYCNALMNYDNINGHGELSYNVIDTSRKRNRIDWCCFIAWTEFIKACGGINTAERNSDGELIERMDKWGAEAKKVNFVGAVHN